MSLDVEAGTVHAVVGENGAGKSTLGKVLAGLYAPDDGEILVDGQPTGRWSVNRAQDHGIVMIAQELSLVPQLTVAQNIFLGLERNVLGLLTGSLRARYDALESTVQFGLDPNVKVEQLKIAEQQKVEILRALARDARVLILDEPTSSLTGHETEQLHATVRSLVAGGTAVIYVSHFLDAVLEVS
ncbi:MAG TPA: ATP-binding cassette domain-containing protein, partial [Gryllotalpicola sp.]